MFKTFLCFQHCVFLHISWEVFLHCEKLVCVVALSKLLAPSQETWATVTELVCAVKGVSELYLSRPKGMMPPPLLKVWEEDWPAASVGLRKRSYFYG